MVQGLLNKGRILSATLALVGSMSTPLAAQELAGAYLAARHAALQSDFNVAAAYFDRARLRDPGQPALMEETVLARLLSGDVAQALPIARDMVAAGIPSQAAHLAMVADLGAQGDYAAVRAWDTQAQGIGPLVDGLLTAWAAVGAGDIAAAEAGFDAVGRTQGLGAFAAYHKALARAMRGDFFGADAILSSPEGAGLVRTKRGAVAHAEILSQLGRQEEAIARLSSAFGTDRAPEPAALVARLRAGEVLSFDSVRTPSDGFAEVFYSLANALRGEGGLEYALLYGRLSRFLRPDHVDAVLLNAELLEGLDQYALAIAAYKQVPATHPAFSAAELGRAAALRRADKPDAAIEVLEQLARDYPQLPMVHSNLGDALRAEAQFEAAIAAYDRAIALVGPEVRAQWFLHYARAISYERLGQWAAAEADFRRALALNPDQPQVLNYLGYSMVEKQINLDEALDMIQRAAAASPQSGYIIDSLGWVLYRLGRYEEAVVHMERAVALMPVDPVVNDHLGDVLWAVGRVREARFQWSRALSFVDPDVPNSEAQPERMRRKLDIGLDAVLREEGAPPLKVAHDAD